MQAGAQAEKTWRADWLLGGDRKEHCDNFALPTEEAALFPARLFNKMWTTPHHPRLLLGVVSHARWQVEQAMYAGWVLLCHLGPLSVSLVSLVHHWFGRRPLSGSLFFLVWGATGAIFNFEGPGGRGSASRLSQSKNPGIRYAPRGPPRGPVTPQPKNPVLFRLR
jgi:hypothetical protein